ncbi:MAG: hypothetical protein IPK12_03765 [Gemmatimonadetes bacterium]|nr:hypothetical protein [Gemmatimonadota bacterium]
MAKKLSDLAVKKPSSESSVKGGKRKLASLRKMAKKKSSMRANKPKDL